MCKSISREINIVNEWFCVNKLSLNLEKTHFILSTNCKSVKNRVIKINYNVIKRVKDTKILGIYVNENLSWMDHISYISNKLSKGIAIHYRVSSIINMDALRNLYCTLILPYLSYCAMVWGSTYTTNSMSLYLKHKKAITIVCNVKYRDHTPELFYNMKLLTIYQIIKFQTGIFMHKAFHMKLPFNQQKLFLLKRPDYVVVTRQSGSFRQTYVHTTKKQHCVSVTGIKLRNCIENYIKNSKTEQAIKTKFKCFFNIFLSRYCTKCKKIQK